LLGTDVGPIKSIYFSELLDELLALPGQLVICGELSEFAGR